MTPLQPARGEIARLERDDEVVEVTVLDIGEGGALIDIVENVAIGDHVVLTSPGVKAIAAEAVRSVATVLEYVSNRPVCGSRTCAIW